MLLVALKEHGYRGRRIRAGQKYEVVTPSDITILIKARLARYAVQPTATQTPTTPAKPEIKKPETREVKPAPLTEVAPVEEETVSDVFNEGTEELESPPSGSSRRRRQYKRKDMVSE